MKKEAVVPGPSSYELTFGSQCPEDPCPPFPRRPSVHRHLSRALPSDRSRGKLAPGARCHAAIARAYRKHPMGRSLNPVELVAIPDTAPPSFQAQGLEYSVERRGDRVFHKETKRDASGRVVSQIEAEARYAIGSGEQALAFLLERGDGHLFESPITWYSRTQKWDLSPGYEKDNLHFEITVSRQLAVGLLVLLVLLNTYLVGRRLEVRRLPAKLISNTIQNELIRLQSFTDPLTEVYNRRSLDEMAGRFISHARRLSNPLSFLLVDVLTMIWYAAVDQAHTWVWWAAGVVLGLAILALFAVFEKRRNDVLHLIEAIRRWA